MAAPLGNQNAAKAKVWRSAIERALEVRTQSRLDGKKEIDALAERLLDLVSAGEISALKEFGDRMDGKPAQAVTVLGDSDNPLVIQKLERIIVRSNSTDTNG